MESVSSYYKEEPYFTPSEYLESQKWLSCDEQERLFHYHYNQDKRGLSCPNRSTPLQDLSRLPRSPEQQEDVRVPRKVINPEFSYNGGTYSYQPYREPTEWLHRRIVEPEGVYQCDVYHSGNRHISPRRSRTREGNRKALGHYEPPPPWDVDSKAPQYDVFLVDGRRQISGHRHDLATEVTEGPHASSVPSTYYKDVYRDTAQFPSSSSTSMWHPWDDVSRPVDRSTVMSPSSPLDSGLSSQSVASTPNSELEPLTNWDQTIPEHGDSFQKCYAEISNARLCQPEMCSSPLRNDQQQSGNCIESLSRNVHQPLARDYKNHFSSASTRELQGSHVQCNFHSSIESVSDSYELKNGSWASYPDKRERVNNSNRYSVDIIDSSSRFDRLPTYQNSTSDGASESTLKESSATCEIVSPKHGYSDSSDTTYKMSNEQVRQKSSDCYSKEVESLRQKQRMKDSKKTEKALSELEEIYNRLNLDDYDLLDRAERRDLPTAHQMMADDSCKSHPLTRSKSDTFYEIYSRAYGLGYTKSPRAPPLRRAGIPDRIADDMALRKQQKPFSKFRKPAYSSSSYLLCSSHFTPSIPPVVKDFPFVNKPDVEYDDLSYRKYFQPRAYHELPQPPFGIPLHPMVQCPNSNYLHATPSSVPRNLCHARVNPDLVRDDMAFRNLRKDNPPSFCS